VHCEEDVNRSRADSLSTLSETFRPEVFTESEGECGENKVEQQWCGCAAVVVGQGGGRA
jgi:hypothetical protein